MDLILPQNVELEQALLGGILIDPSSLSLAKSIISPQDFYLEPHSEIYQAMLALSDRGAQPDSYVVVDYLRDSGANDRGCDAGYVMALMNTVASAAGVEQHALQVKEKSRQRGVIRALEEVRGQLYNSVSTADGAIQTLRQRFDMIAGGVGDGQVRTIDELAVDWLLHLQKSQGEMISTGHDWLDGLTGGWSAGDLWIWAARTNTGKTRMLIPWLLETSHAGANCGLISLDMGRTRLTKYLLSSDNALAGYPTHTDPVEMVRLGHCDVSPGVSYFKAKYGSGLYVIPEPRSDTLSLERYVRALAGKYKCKVIAIDQAQNFADYHQEDLQSIGGVVKSCKDWAKHYGVSIVLVHQINRAGYDQPTLKNLKDSSCFAEYSDFVVILHDRAKAIMDVKGAIIEDEKHPGHYRVPKESDPKDSLIYQVPSTRFVRFSLEKSRHGDTSARMVRFDFAQGVTIK